MKWRHLDMTQNTFSNKKRSFNLFVDTILRNKNLLIIYTIIMFLSTSFPNWISAYNSKKEGLMNPEFVSYRPQNYMGFAIVGFIVAICLATVVTKFMHQRKSIDLYYALPIKKESVFMSHYFAGLALLMIPFVINVVIIAIVDIVYSYGTNSIHLYFIQVFVTALMTMVTYSLAIFVAVQLGTSFDTFSMSIVFHFALPISISLLVYSYASDLYGFIMPSWIENAIAVMCPTGVLAKHLMRIGRYQGYLNSLKYGGETSFDPLSLVPIFAWVIIAIGIVFLSRWMFKKRKSETGGFTQENSIFVIALKLILTFAGGYLMTTILSATLYTDTIFVRILGFIIGTVVAFLILQAIAARGFKNLAKSLPQYAGVVVLGIAIIIINSTGGLGYEKRVPKPENVKSVTVRHPILPMGELQYISSYNRQYNYEITDPSIINTVVDVHKTIVENKNSEVLYYGNVADIEYKLTNGKTMSRYYYYNAEDGDLLSSIITPDYIKIYHPVYNIDDNNIKSMKIHGIGNAGYIELNKSQYMQIIEALQMDILDLYDSGDSSKKQNTLYKVELEYAFNIDEDVNQTLIEDYMYVKSSFTNTIKVIKDLENVYEPLSLNAESINSIYKLKDEYVRFVNMNNNLHDTTLDYLCNIIRDEEYREKKEIEDTQSAAYETTVPLYATNTDDVIAEYFDIIKDKKEIEKYISRLEKIYENPSTYEYDPEKFDIVYIRSTNDIQQYGDYLYVEQPLFLPKE